MPYPADLVINLENPIDRPAMAKRYIEQVEC